MTRWRQRMGEERIAALPQESLHVAIKTGAEAVFVAILPDQDLGIAVKVADGTTRGAECAITALLIRAGALAAHHPAVTRFWNTPIVNCSGRTTGWIRPGTALA